MEQSSKRKEVIQAVDRTNHRGAGGTKGPVARRVLALAVAALIAGIAVVGLGSPPAEAWQALNYNTPGVVWPQPVWGTTATTCWPSTSFYPAACVHNAALQIPATTVERAPFKGAQTVQVDYYLAHYTAGGWVGRPTETRRYTIPEDHQRVVLPMWKSLAQVDYGVYNVGTVYTWYSANGVYLGQTAVYRNNSSSDYRCGSALPITCTVGRGWVFLQTL